MKQRTGMKPQKSGSLEIGVLTVDLIKYEMIILKRPA